MFRRRKPEPIQPTSQPAVAEIEPEIEEERVSLPNNQGPSMTNKPPTPPMRPDIPRRVMDIPTAAGRGPVVAPAAPAAAPKAPETEVKKLIVGRDISLSGNITACDKLVVEGTVEANLTDAGSIEIAETGLYKGAAEVDEAEIGGRFQGELTVRKKLTIRATGKVVGTVRYARLVVEGGGEIGGTVEVIAQSRAAGSDEPRAAAAAPAFRMAEPK